MVLELFPYQSVSLSLLFLLLLPQKKFPIGLYLLPLLLLDLLHECHCVADAGQLPPFLLALVVMRVGQPNLSFPLLHLSMKEFFPLGDWLGAALDDDFYPLWF